MSTLASRAMAIGFIFLLISVSAGMHSGAGAFGLLLCFTGILTGANLVTVGVRTANDVPAPTAAAVFRGARALAAFLRRNVAVVGLVIVSCAFTAVSGEAGPVLCFAMFALILIGINLINHGVHGE